MNKCLNKTVIVKFFTNTNSANKNKLITRTLMKVGVIDNSTPFEKQPEHGEFWKVKIIKETAEGKASGCFILHPVEKIDVKEITKLVPGMYDEELINNVLYITPKDEYKNLNCILALSHRKNIKGIYAVILGLE